MNHLTLEKQQAQVRYWAKLGSLTLTCLPRLLRKDCFWKSKQWKDLSTSQEKVYFLLGVLLMGLIIYLVNYYTLSSLFWPEPLSLVNHLLLVPSLVGTGVSCLEVGWVLKKL